MIHEALKWAVEHTLETTHLAASAGGVNDFAVDVPRALAESPQDAVFQYEVLLRALRNPSLREDVRKSYDDYISAISHALGTLDIKGEAIARLVFAALDGLTLQQLLYDDRHRTEDALVVLRQLLATASTFQPTEATRNRERPRVTCTNDEATANG